MVKYFDFNTAKRYFHFVVLRFNLSYSVQSYWRDCGVQRNTSQNDYSFENEEFRIEQQSLLSDLRYFTGAKDYSLNEDGNPPFRYDLVAMEIKGENFLVIGFPFKFLAKHIVETLVEKKKYLSKASFVKPDLNRLIKQSLVSSFSKDGFRCHFSSLGLTLTGDSSLTSIDLGGNSPMDSPIYKSIFENVVKQKKSHMESCSLKSELDANEEAFTPKTRGNVHLDHFGNLKVYVHGGGKNVFVIPPVLNLLRKKKCIETTLINPLLHLKDE